MRPFGNRWVAKLKDGVSFGMEYCDIVELEEERWMLQASSLKVTKTLCVRQQNASLASSLTRPPLV